MANKEAQGAHERPAFGKYHIRVLAQVANIYLPRLGSVGCCDVTSCPGQVKGKAQATQTLLFQAHPCPRRAGETHLTGTFFQKTFILLQEMFSAVSQHLVFGVE